MGGLSTSLRQSWGSTPSQQAGGLAEYLWRSTLRHAPLMMMMVVVMTMMTMMIAMTMTMMMKMTTTTTMALFIACNLHSARGTN